MMFGLQLLLASFLAPGGSYAAECCSWKHKIDTDHLSKLAERFCADPMGHAYTKGTGKTEYWELNKAHYNILATHWERTFPNCTHALTEIIDQCQGKGFGVGTWGTEVLKPGVDDNIGEFYSITADEVYNPKRRDFRVLPPFPTQGDVVSGTYSLDGQPLEVFIREESDGFQRRAARDIIPGVPTGASSSILSRGNDPSLTTTYKNSTWDQTYTNNDDLASLIASSARQRRRRATKKKRLLDKWFPKCDTKDHTYVVTAAGTWRTDVELASGTYQCGEGSKCRNVHPKEATWGMSIKGGALDSGEALDAGRDVGIAWAEKVTESKDETCSWSEGHCHAVFHQVDMGWTRGYQLLHHEWMVEVHVVNVDAPLQHGYIKRCDLGCCHPAVVKALRPSLCEDATNKNRDWYGVCSDAEVEPGTGSCSDISFAF